MSKLREYFVIIFFLLTLSCRFVSAGVIFTALDECDLYSSVEKQENIDNIRTSIGKIYDVVSQKKYSDYWEVYAENAYPKNRWVHKYCGSVASSEPFTPFFVDGFEMIEGQTQKPIMTQFDIFALEKCGNWGNFVSDEDFDALISDDFVLDFLYNKLNGYVITKGASKGLFKKELRSVWMRNHAFEHVVCGQPHSKSLGGLHYVGRYFEAQNNNWVGLSSSCGRMEVENPIYNIGVDFINSSGGISSKCPVSYQYDMGVVSIIVEGTKAFRELRLFGGGSSGNIVCTYTDTGGNYHTVVERNDALVTFYPVLTSSHPSCLSNK